MGALFGGITNGLGLVPPEVIQRAQQNQDGPQIGFGMPPSGEYPNPDDNEGGGGMSDERWREDLFNSRDDIPDYANIPTAPQAPEFKLGPKGPNIKLDKMPGDLFNAVGSMFGGRSMFGGEQNDYSERLKQIHELSGQGQQPGVSGPIMPSDISAPGFRQTQPQTPLGQVSGQSPFLNTIGMWPRY